MSVYPLIAFDNIRQGDIIAMHRDRLGTHEVVTGKAHKLEANRLLKAWVTEEDGLVASNGGKYPATHYLVERPGKPLPTEPGTLILSTHPAKNEPKPLVLRDDGYWWELDGEGCYGTKFTQQHPWVLAEVKAVEG